MILDLAGVFVVALLASWALCRAIISFGPRDAPDEARKLQAKPVPTSGGLGIGVGYGAGMLLLAAVSLNWRHSVSDAGVLLLWITAAFAYPLLLVGFIDDAVRLDAKLKFALYGVFAFAAAWFAGPVREFPLPSGAVLHLSLIVALIGTALWLFTLINVVNFMDGANGLAIGSVTVALGALCAIAFERDVHSVAALTLCGAGAMIGFLMWNFPAGRLFAGDSGALFAGALGGFAALILIARTDLSPLIPPIVFFPLLADALLTLWWRVRRGRSVMVGHSDHIYQIVLRRWPAHAPVALAYWAAMAACGALGFTLARLRNPQAEWIALGGLAVAAVAISVGVRAWAKKHNLLSNA